MRMSSFTSNERSVRWMLIWFSDLVAPLCLCCSLITVRASPTKNDSDLRRRSIACIHKQHAHAGQFVFTSSDAIPRAICQYATEAFYLCSYVRTTTNSSIFILESTFWPCFTDSLILAVISIHTILAAFLSDYHLCAPHPSSHQMYTYGLKEGSSRDQGQSSKAPLVNALERCQNVIAPWGGGTYQMSETCLVCSKARHLSMETYRRGTCQE